MTTPNQPQEKWKCHGSCSEEKEMYKEDALRMARLVGELKLGLLAKEKENEQLQAWKDSVLDKNFETSHAEIDRLGKEIDEQCRLNQMGQERELKLMTEIETLKRQFEKDVRIQTLMKERQRAEDYEKALNKLISYTEELGGCIDGHELPEDETIWVPCNKCTYCKSKEFLAKHSGEK